jgi:hypothetical protein
MNDLEKHIHGAYQDKIYIEYMRACLHMIKLCECFHLGKINDFEKIAIHKSFINVRLFSDVLATNITLPYDRTWVDYIHTTKTGVINKYGMLCISSPIGNKTAMVVNFFNKLENVGQHPSWILYPINYAISIGRPILSTSVGQEIMRQERKLDGKSNIEEDQFNNMYAMNQYDITNKSQIHEAAAAIKNDESTVQPPLIALNSFLKIISCKNVTSEVVKPFKKMKIGKKVKKIRRRNMMDYKILKIVLPKKKNIKNREINLSNPSSACRLHMCRSHFRTYTEEAPLFGKITGTFLIPEHIRGDKSEGFVTKDYDIKVE